MVNGNYLHYGDRPSSESEIVDDHVQARTAERKEKKRSHRTVNELNGPLKALNNQLDNDTDSVKYEKKIKEPRLLRYVPTSDVEENFVTEKFETYHMKPSSEEGPKRYAFTKKPKNPTDGSVNYAYSRSSSNSSNGNLPTISEHGEQYTYRMSAPKDDISMPFESKLDKYFDKPREPKKFGLRAKVKYDGSHPDSLYRVTSHSVSGGCKLSRVMRALRWPAALFVVCAALAAFVYFLLPDSLEMGTDMVNSTFWEGIGVNHHQYADTHKSTSAVPTGSVSNKTRGTTKKPIEIDFFEADTEKNYKIFTIIETITEKSRKLPVPPVYPSHISPEVQYGDKDKARTPKLFDDKNQLSEDSTLKPHITQKPEKPLAVYFKDATPTSLNVETINRAETINRPDANLNDFKIKDKQILAQQPGPSAEQKHPKASEPEVPVVVDEYYPYRPLNVDTKFTSGHSKIFGVGIEDIEKMQSTQSSTTQSSAYNTRVSPTLPTWRDGDDSTTKKYPVNLDAPQCRSPSLAMCRGVLPYDLAGPPPRINGVEITKHLPDLQYIVSTNCSQRARQFVCSLLEPECNPAPFPPKRPCFSLCRDVMDSCEPYIQESVSLAFNCNQYDHSNCMAARTPCFRNEMACSDGTCIPRERMCNGIADCPGLDDEKQCGKCDEHHFECPSGGCILKSWTCDGFKDCSDGEDEKEEMCARNRHDEVAAPAQAGEEPGEEGAGSAPAPSVRRPNTVPDTKNGRQRNRARIGEDTSQELLMTSENNNALKRNFTRRPSSSRLKPYRPKPRTTTAAPADEHEDKETTDGTSHTKFNKYTSKIKKPTTTTVKPLVETQNEESTEDLTKDIFDKINERKQQMGPQQLRAPLPIESKDTDQDAPFDFDKNHNKAPNSRVDEPHTRLFNFTKNTNDINRVIDSASLLRKTLAEEEAYQRERLKRPDEMAIDEEDRRHSGRDAGRSSPCPTGELRCVDGLCITLLQLCDGNIDCSDHADEDNCFT